MAEITATGNGNWSSTTPDAPWPNGTLPGAGDSVDCSSYTITIDQDITVAELLCGGGGTFQVVSGTRTINANVINTSSSFQCLYISGGTVTLNGDITGPPNSETATVYNESTLTINGDIVGGAGPDSIAVLNVATLSAITGNLTGGEGTRSVCLHNFGTCGTITGNLTPGDGILSAVVSNGSATPVVVDGYLMHSAAGGWNWAQGPVRLTSATANTITVYDENGDTMVLSSGGGPGISNVTIVIGGNVVRR